MGFVPPLNLGEFQPSPATLAQWVYQIWQYLQENPIATEEQLKEYIGTFITTSPETQAMIGEGVEQYLTENPPTAPVQSVQGKKGAVQLAYNEIVPASNAVPVYKASSTPNTNTLVGQYNLGYRLFVNTTTQEIFTISPAGALSLVGRGKFDGTTIDLDTTQGDTTISEAINDLTTTTNTITEAINNLTTITNALAATNSVSWTEIGISFVARRWGNIVFLSANSGTTTTPISPNENFATVPEGYRPVTPVFMNNVSAVTKAALYLSSYNGGIKYSANQPELASGAYIRFTICYICTEDFPT